MTSPSHEPVGRVFSVGTDKQVLEAVFYRIGDRFTHRVVLSSGNQSRTLLTAMEGETDETWPASPPLQQLSIETRGQSQVALLVGMSGKTHFSASVESIPGKCRLEFDVAARVHTDPAQIGSAYQLSTSNLLPTHCLQAADSTSQTVWKNGVVQIEPIPTKTAPVTLRWRYWVQLAPEDSIKVA